MNIMDEIRQKESQCIVEGLSMMAYNPSIGRVLEKGGVNKFVKIMVGNINRLNFIEDQDNFDVFHDEMVAAIMSSIKTNRNQDMSYGQAQKPLNVFLKVYVDWSNRPQTEIASRVKRFLHVPLDSILMTEVKEKFNKQFDKIVVDSFNSLRESYKSAISQTNDTISDKVIANMINPYNFSLTDILTKDMYYAWQYCLRDINPDRPVLLDVLWSMKRRGNFEENGTLN